MLSNYEERLVFAFGCSNIECTLQRLNMLAAIAVEQEFKTNIKVLAMKLIDAESIGIYEEVIAKVAERHNLVRRKDNIFDWVDYLKVDEKSIKFQEKKRLNKVLLIGILTRNPEIRIPGNDNNMKVARYTLAVDRRGKKEDSSPDFISCVVFGKGAEFVQKYLHRGTNVGIV